MYRNIFLILAMAMGVSIIACQPDDSSDRVANHLEQAGEEMKEAGRAMAKKTEDVGEEMAERAREVGNEMADGLEETCEEIKEGAGAADTDC